MVQKLGPSLRRVGITVAAKGVFGRYTRLEGPWFARVVRRRTRCCECPPGHSGVNQR